MYEYMAEFKAVHVMQLPNSASDAASRALWKTEILRLQQVIEARFGTPISEAALREAIVLKNRERRALAHFIVSGQLNPPALSGGDILKVVYGATFRFDKTALIDELHAMAERIHQEWQQGKRLEPRPRILITGCPIGGAAEKWSAPSRKTAAGWSAMRTAPARKRPSAAWRKRATSTTP